MVTSSNSDPNNNNDFFRYLIFMNQNMKKKKKKKSHIIKSLSFSPETNKMLKSKDIVSNIHRHKFIFQILTPFLLLQMHESNNKNI